MQITPRISLPIECFRKQAIQVMTRIDTERFSLSTPKEIPPIHSVVFSLLISLDSHYNAKNNFIYMFGYRELHPHRKLQIIIIIFLLSWLIGTFLIHRFESAQNWSYFDAFYFTVITTATIGFWDLVPHSIAGKILTMMYAIIYVPLFLYSMTLVFQWGLQKIKTEEELFEKTLHDTEEDVETILESNHR